MIGIHPLVDKAVNDESVVFVVSVSVCSAALPQPPTIPDPTTRSAPSDINFNLFITHAPFSGSGGREGGFLLPPLHSIIQRSLSLRSLLIDIASGMPISYNCSNFHSFSHSLLTLGMTGKILSTIFKENMEKFGKLTVSIFC
ncbi:MAG: hypothetical protein A3K03_04150 [Bdellovibrionales bacterium RIFOXYD1_FULL_44_7]|nr:MAG: hypothetical protein A3K03_04150 [Bdellovibrionales bacterium RIFOXYD1_FULL_44_7]